MKTVGIEVGPVTTTVGAGKPGVHLAALGPHLRAAQLLDRLGTTAARTARGSSIPTAELSREEEALGTQGGVLQNQSRHPFDIHS